MKHRFSSTRRAFLMNSSIVALATNLPANALFASTHGSKFTLKGLDSQIIEHVNTLTQDKKFALTILQPEGSLGNVEPIGEVFYKHTGIKIHYIEASLDEINAKILAQSLSNETYYDIALPATFGLPDLIEAGAIRNLDDFVEIYEPINFKDGMLYDIGDYYKGGFFGYQTDGDTYLMFYNQAWLEDKQEQEKFKEEFGYPLAIPKTWDELDQMIKFFDRPDENKSGGALFRNKDYIAWEWWSRFHAKGYFPFDNMLKPQINTQAGIEALTDLIETTKYLYKDTKTNGLFENWEAFAEGNMFCNIGWGGTQKFLNGPKSNVKDRLVYAPSPGGLINNELVHTPYFNWGWNYTVSSFSKQPELAYLFTLYACSPTMSTEAVKYSDGYFDPFRIEHYADTEIQKTYSESFLAAHKFSMENSIPDLYMSGQGEYWDILKENISLADDGKLTPKEALDTTTKAWNQISSRYGLTNQLEQWKFLKNQYPKKLQDKLI